MSVLLYLTEKQKEIFSPIAETLDSVNVDWTSTGVELTKENYVPVQEAIQKSIFNDILDPKDDVREHLQHISMRVISLHSHFPTEEIIEEESLPVEVDENNNEENENNNEEARSKSSKRSR